MEPITLSYPACAVLMLVGPSGSGKSTFAARHFTATEILSSDDCRARVADDPAAQQVTDDAFALLHFTLDLRLKNRRFTVVDSTALRPSARAQIVATAAKRHTHVYALILDVPIEECVRRDDLRMGRTVGQDVIVRQYVRFEQARREIEKDVLLAGVRRVTPDEIERIVVERGRPTAQGGLFDVIGDVHGCYPELLELLDVLGYDRETDGLPRHPAGRTPVFVGDLADRGPDSPGVLRLVASLVAAGLGLFAPGNHDDKLFRLLRGAKVARTHGLDTTEAQLDTMQPALREALVNDILTYLASTAPYLVLDGGALVVAHAGIREEMIGRVDGAVKSFTLYGDVRGFEPGTNKPIRHDWASEYRGSAFIAYGHTPKPALVWQTDVAARRKYVAVPFVNNTVNLDTGCVFGGALTALRWPERELVSVPVQQAYAEHEGLEYSKQERG
jgi:protein phosphatase